MLCFKCVMVFILLKKTTQDTFVYVTQSCIIVVIIETVAILVSLSLLQSVNVINLV